MELELESKFGYWREVASGILVAFDRGSSSSTRIGHATRKPSTPELNLEPKATRGILNVLCLSLLCRQLLLGSRCG